MCDANVATSRLTEPMRATAVVLAPTILTHRMERHSFNHALGIVNNGIVTGKRRVRPRTASSANEFFSVGNSERDHRNTRLRGRFRAARGRGEGLERWFFPICCSFYP